MNKIALIRIPPIGKCLTQQLKKMPESQLKSPLGSQLKSPIGSLLKSCLLLLLTHDFMIYCSSTEETEEPSTTSKPEADGDDTSLVVAWCLLAISMLVNLLLAVLLIVQHYYYKRQTTAGALNTVWYKQSNNNAHDSLNSLYYERKKKEADAVADEESAVTETKNNANSERLNIRPRVNSDTTRSVGQIHNRLPKINTSGAVLDTPIDGGMGRFSPTPNFAIYTSETEYSTEPVIEDEEPNYEELSPEQESLTFSNENIDSKTAIESQIFIDPDYEELPNVTKISDKNTKNYNFRPTEPTSLPPPLCLQGSKNSLLNHRPHSGELNTVWYKQSNNNVHDSLNSLYYERKKKEADAGADEECAVNERDNETDNNLESITINNVPANTDTNRLNLPTVNNHESINSLYWENKKTEVDEESAVTETKNNASSERLSIRPRVNSDTTRSVGQSHNRLPKINTSGAVLDTPIDGGMGRFPPTPNFAIYTSETEYSAEPVIEDEEPNYEELSPEQESQTFSNENIDNKTAIESQIDIDPDYEELSNVTKISDKNTKNYKFRPTEPTSLPPPFRSQGSKNSLLNYRPHSGIGFMNSIDRKENRRQSLNMNTASDKNSSRDIFHSDNNKEFVQERYNDSEYPDESLDIEDEEHVYEEYTGDIKFGDGLDYNLERPSFEANRNKESEIKHSETQTKKTYSFANQDGSHSKLMDELKTVFISDESDCGHGSHGEQNLGLGSKKYGMSSDSVNSTNNFNSLNKKKNCIKDESHSKLIEELKNRGVKGEVN
ncbi:unnamed protein product [Meganyctiphanes norvegica]|uniref:Uncharacterized protein n=1 Tax=Meganyctiphanes norvegica TaxID=48144 RepID=A0AAV2Q3P1_MEGNR